MTDLWRTHRPPPQRPLEALLSLFGGLLFRGSARQHLLPTSPNAWITEYQAPFRRIRSETRFAIRILQQPPTLERAPATVHDRGSAGKPNGWCMMFQFIDPRRS